ncbi:hypothetical protein [Arhodomonas sp. AD133]|uniref:hypothetical protein n=1 Tax=Arhodomonas sp. AD133 TaxID=3415009 RepID=UPI003EBF5759
MRPWARLLLWGALLIALAGARCEFFFSTGDDRDARATGVWTGEVFADGARREVIWLAQGGDLFAADERGARLFSGDYGVFGDHVDGDLVTFDAAGDRQARRGFSGTLRSERIWRADLDGPGGIDLRYAHASFRSTSLTRIDGQWREEHQDRGTLLMTVDPDGRTFGSDMQGCTFSGELVVPQRRRNVYVARFDIAGCALRGDDYRGLATRLLHGGSDRLLVLISDGERMLRFRLHRP